MEEAFKQVLKAEEPRSEDFVMKGLLLASCQPPLPCSLNDMTNERHHDTVVFSVVS